MYLITYFSISLFYIATLQMVTNYLIDKEIHLLQQELQSTVMTSPSVKQFSASLSLSKPRYAKHLT